MADASQPKTGGLWARMRGLTDADETPIAGEPATAPSATAANPEVACAEAVCAEAVEAVEVIDDEVSFGEIIEPTDASPTVKLPAVQAPVPPFALNPLEAELAPVAVPIVSPPIPSLAIPITPAALPPCISCGTPRKTSDVFCGDCGYLFPTGAAANMPVAPAPLNEIANGPTPAASSLRIKGRYLLGNLLSEKLGVKRFRGLDASVEPSVPVIIVQAPIEDEPPMAQPLEVAAEAMDDDLLPTFDSDLIAAIPETVPMAEIQAILSWPRPSWEKDIVERVNLSALPGVVDYFLEKNTEYFVLEVPQGELLWDAWDDPTADAGTRYGWLKQLAEVFAALHKAGVLIECLSPDQLIVDGAKRLRITDLGDLLPLPLPINAPIRGSLYTSPELILAPDTADARASLYTFGAILYSLEYLHHGLEEKDFESKYVPKQITDRYPDVHPLLPRLLNKTFVKDPDARFPTDEASRTDATGITELIHTLEVCQKVFDSVRLDIAAWTTTGMVRTGNEDAFAFLHGVDSRQDELYEYALILLCDGMGGYDAGEIAAALAITKMKEFFLQQPMFAALAGKESFPVPTDIEATKKLFSDGLRHANREVHTASRTPGKGKRGMGCTAEAVYVDPRHIFVGHVGDSRVYHLKDGRLIQLTRDQTLVNRLVELGQIKPEEAEDHPRKNELQQAIGGQPDVTPGSYHSRLKRGDWILVCSDGLSNHITNQELEKMLTREASNSAEEAARRLLNLVNLRGATDNATIVVIRAT